MYIDHLSITNFRNYARLELRLPADRPILLIGANAQGKTGLLEAIYYIATAHSPHTATDRQLIHWRAEDDPIPFARLAADVCGRGGTMRRVEMTLMLERMAESGAYNGGGAASMRFRKTIKVDGVEKRVMDIVGLLNVVLFLPQDLTLIEGAPSDRRRFMDDTLGQVDAAYLNALDQYDKILPQRNALLKRIGERKANARELAYWDEQLIRAGAALIAGRQRFLRELEVSAQAAHLDLTGRRESLTLRYQPSFVPTAAGDGQRSFDLLGLDLHRDMPPEQIEPQFAAQLTAEQGESIARGMTLSGPHRDELRLFINDRDAGLYGSRGQARTAVMALKLAELAWMRQRTGETPILLLDEVAAELDASRRAYLLERVGAGTQTLMTTTERDIFTPDFLARAAVWTVTAGRIDRPPS
jgi:DNA replication and repair protein RecF